MAVFNSYGINRYFLFYCNNEYKLRKFRAEWFNYIEI